jgi:hypothetical protein
MDKKFKHVGMEMKEAEHEKWHKEHPEMTEVEHQTLMKKMGVSEEEDRKWHEKHDTPKDDQTKAGSKTVNPFAIGGGFLDYCIRQGWLIQEGKSGGAEYYVTNEGEKELKKFGIRI